MQNYLQQLQSPLGNTPQPSYKGGWNVGSNMLSNAFRSAASKAAYGLPLGEMGDALGDWATGKQINQSLYSNNFSGAVDQFTDQLPPLRILKNFANLGSQSSYDPQFEQWKRTSQQPGFFKTQEEQKIGYNDGGQVMPNTNRNWQNVAGQFGQNMLHSLGNQFAQYMGANPSYPYQNYNKPPEYQQWLEDMFYQYSGLQSPNQQQGQPQQQITPQAGVEPQETKPIYPAYQWRTSQYQKPQVERGYYKRPSQLETQALPPPLQTQMLPAQRFGTLNQPQLKTQTLSNYARPSSKLPLSVQQIPSRSYNMPQPRPVMPIEPAFGIQENARTPLPQQSGVLYNPYTNRKLNNAFVKEKLTQLAFDQGLQMPEDALNISANVKKNMGRYKNFSCGGFVGD